MKLRKFISFISFILLPITLNYFSPVLIVQGSFERVLTGMHIVFGLMILSAVFLGGAWCSYICPFGALQDLIPNTKLKYKLPNLKPLTGTVFLLLIVVPVVIHGFEKTIIPYHMVETKVSIDSFRDLIRFYIIILSIILITMILGKRAWCRSLCPMYIFNYIGIKLGKLLKLPTLQIRINNKECTKCRNCIKNCLKGLDVCAMVENNKWNTNECIHCGECIHSCKHNVLKTKNFNLPIF